MRCSSRYTTETRQSTFNKGKGDAKEQIGDELAQQGKWPAGPPYEESRTKEVLADHVEKAKAHPLWTAVINAAKYYVQGNGAGCAKMRGRVIQWNEEAFITE